MDMITMLAFWGGHGWILSLCFPHANKKLIRRGFVKSALFALLASVLVGSALGESTEPTTIRITTWNLEWFPSGSAKEAPAEQQNQRIKEAADVLRAINPDIILLQEVRDYNACARLAEAIAPGIYHVAICSAFREPFQRKSVPAFSSEAFDNF
jgi:hypothetical protein